MKLGLIDAATGQIIDYGAIRAMIGPEADGAKLQKHLNQHGCEVCAKGSLLAAWIGNFDSVTANRVAGIALDAHHARFPKGLLVTFGEPLLAAMETAFEHETFSWNHRFMREDEALLTTAFPKKDTLKLILENIVRNKGRMVIERNWGKPPLVIGEEGVVS